MNKLFYYWLNYLTISLLSFSQLHTQFESLIILNNNKKGNETKWQSLCVIETVRTKEKKTK
jgi:hypothetical protein